MSTWLWSDVGWIEVVLTHSKPIRLLFYADTYVTGYRKEALKMDGIFKYSQPFSSLHGSFLFLMHVFSFRADQACVMFGVFSSICYTCTQSSKKHASSNNEYNLRPVAFPT